MYMKHPVWRNLCFTLPDKFSQHPATLPDHDHEFKCIDCREDLTLTTWVVVDVLLRGVFEMTSFDRKNESPLRTWDLSRRLSILFWKLFACSSRSRCTFTVWSRWILCLMQGLSSGKCNLPGVQGADTVPLLAVCLTIKVCHGPWRQKLFGTIWLYPNVLIRGQTDAMQTLKTLSKMIACRI